MPSRQEIDTWIPFLSLLFAPALLIDRKRGSSEKAIRLLKQSIELDRNLGEAYSLLASMHADAGREKEAETLHVKALQVSPWNADFINNYAVFLHSKGICRLSSSYLLSLSLPTLWFQPFPPTLCLSLCTCHFPVIFFFLVSISDFLPFSKTRERERERTDIFPDYSHSLSLHKGRGEFISLLILRLPIWRREETQKKSSKSSLTIYLPHAITCLPYS